MEFTPHHSAQDLFEKGTDFGFVTRVGVLQKASRGLAKLDSNRIPHLDIKSAQVLALLSSCAAAVSWKLSDFARSQSFIQLANRLFTNCGKLQLDYDWP